MPRLTSRQKTYIVRELAAFATPSEVARGLKDEFGLADVPLQQIVQYDPSKPSGSELGKPLRDLFETTRQEYISEVALVPAAHRAYRLRRLHEMAQKAEARNNIPLAASLLKQVAEEIGGKYVNTISVDVSDETMRMLAGLSDEDLVAVATSAPAGSAQVRYDGRVRGRSIISPGVRV